MEIALVDIFHRTCPIISGETRRRRDNREGGKDFIKSGTWF